MNIQAQKTRFIHKVLADNAILAALQRNKTYVASEIDSGPFRVAFADQLNLLTDMYANFVEDEEHCLTIKLITDRLSDNFSGGFDRRSAAGRNGTEGAEFVLEDTVVHGSQSADTATLPD